MKKVSYLFAIFSVFSFFGHAQNTTLSLNLIDGMVINEGDVFIIGEVNAHHTFSYLNVGKPNFTIKKGGLYNPKALTGVEVVVAAIQSSPKGHKITLKRTDANRFLGAHKLIYVRDMEKALAKGELLVKEPS